MCLEHGSGDMEGFVHYELSRVMKAADQRRQVFEWQIQKGKGLEDGVWASFHQGRVC